MATSIIPLAIELAFSPEDAKRAAVYKGYGCEGRWSEPDELMFYFTHHDGNSDHFTPAQLRESTWWRALPFELALSIEANLYPRPIAEGAFRYVARFDRKAGMKLIRGSRLSPYFGGETRRADADRALEALRADHPDAGVFETNDINEAERLLGSENPDEGLLISQERMAIARAARARAALVEVSGSTR